MAQTDAYPGPRSPWVPAAIWVAGAALVWLISFGLQQEWIAGLSLFAVLPLMAALAVAGWRFWRHMPWSTVATGAAQGLLWPSIALALLWIPKAP